MLNASDSHHIGIGADSTILCICRGQGGELVGWKGRRQYQVRLNISKEIPKNIAREIQKLEKPQLAQDLVQNWQSPIRNRTTPPSLVPISNMEIDCGDDSSSTSAIVIIWRKP